MKMENELRAAHRGTVAQIAVAEGTKVEGGTLLIVIRSE
jgi:biotin carboxyl carrier protein